MLNQFGNIYQDKTVLLTGNTGFKGSWLSLWLHRLGAKVIGVSKDIPTKPSFHKLLDLPIETHFVDIRDYSKLLSVFKEHNPNFVFHLAAQALVRPSYKEPLETFETNVIGTANVLEAIRNTADIKAAVIVTSDKCYENQGLDRGYVEEDKLGGRDPYSASKGCAEIVTNSYRLSFLQGLDISIASARAGNVIGGGDWSVDRLIPDIVKAVAKHKSVRLRNPHSTRPWQHVFEPLSGYLLLGQKLLDNSPNTAGSYNFGPDLTGNATVEDVVKMMQSHWAEIKYNVEKSDNLHEAEFLKLDSSKSLSEMMWKPTWSLDKAIKMTSSWYKHISDNPKINILELSINQLNEYINDADDLGQVWVKN